DSSICVAAYHELRLSPWDQRTWTVDLVRHAADIGDYRGSIRQGIRSFSYGRLTSIFHRGWYDFSSPRVAEPLQDLTSVHVRYRFDLGQNHVQYCFSTSNRSVDFKAPRRLAKERSATELADGVHKKVWPSGTDSAAGLGGFSCSIRGTVLSWVTSLAMPRSEMVPDHLSRTVDVGQSASILSPGGAPLWWTKDDSQPLRQKVVDRGSRLLVAEAQLGDAGVYALHFRHQETQAARLVVRVCPSKTYGYQCRRTCPTCHNGGVCHDITGVCVCPPGFTGENCEEACGETKFGLNCTHDCKVVADDAGASPDCSGMLFCLPDPYGCSCYPGFWGIDCDKGKFPENIEVDSLGCPDNTYGPDCRLKRKCYCPEGQTCHPRWGFCANGTCRQGFKNEPFCDQSYPALRSFTVQSLDEESFHVTWKAWSKNLDTGQGDAESYRILYKMHGSMDWNQTDLIAEDGNDTLAYDIGDLAANTEYDVRVVVHDVSGEENVELAPLARTTTPCGGRVVASTSSTAFEPGNLSLLWHLPDSSTWQCSRIRVQLMVNDSQPLEVGGGDRYSLAVKPFTTYVLRVRLVTGLDMAGDWSSPLGVVTPEDAPEEVATVRAYRVSRKTYMLSWRPPSESNGIVRGYEVHYVRLRLLNECKTVPSSNQLSVASNQTFLRLFNLTGGADYEVSVRATTVKDGPWKNHLFTTSHEEPDGPPLHLVLREVTPVTAAVYWSPPDCLTTNGIVDGYQLRLSSQAPWVAEELVNLTGWNGFQLTNLIPFTDYHFGVAAGNSAGTGPEATLDFKTLPGAPPPPGNLTAYSTGCDFIAITWLAPYPPAGIPESFEVFYKLKSETTFRGSFMTTPASSVCESDVRQGRQCAVVHKLNPNTEYQIFVIAKNQGVELWSDRSDTIIAETKETGRVHWFKNCATITRPDAFRQRQPSCIRRQMCMNGMRGAIKRSSARSAQRGQFWFRRIHVAVSVTRGEIECLKFLNAESSCHAQLEVTDVDKQASQGRVTSRLGHVTQLRAHTSSCFFVFVYFRLRLRRREIGERATTNSCHCKNSHPILRNNQTCLAVPDPPSQLVQDTREESSMTVSWKEPMISHGIITGYRVKLTSQYADPEQRESVEVGAETRNHIFLFLKPGTTFTVTVEAKTSAGYGKPIELVAHTRAPGRKNHLKRDIPNTFDNCLSLSHYPWLIQPSNRPCYEVKNTTERNKRSASGRDGVHEWTAGKVDYNMSQEMGLPYYMAAQMTSETIRNRSDFTVGDGKYYGGFYNAPLVAGSTYDIGLAAEADFEGATGYLTGFSPKQSQVKQQEVTTSGTAITAILVSLLVVMVVLLAVTWYRKRKRERKRERRSLFNIRRYMSGSGQSRLSELATSGLPRYRGAACSMEEIHTTELSSSKPIPVAGLQEYVQRMLICEGFKPEYTSQGRGPQHPTTEGQRPENRIKNRYGNQLPYDHSRVRLKPTPGIAFSDYINANYIDGYCRPKRYIATQGPRTNTVTDFWKMVWQENVCKIVMLTNLIEKGKAKCEQYWPDEAATYGDIQVHLIASETFPDYDVRQLHLTFAETMREVKHFHLRSWPDHGVPLYPNVLLAFRKKVNQYRAFNEAPVVVHCSAGVGRTGAYILLDTLQEQAMSEGVVDVVGQLAAIRKSRMNLVETLEQYNLVYRALMESMCVRDHSVPCIKLEERLKELLSLDEATGNPKLVAEFQELNTLKPWFTPSDFIATRQQSGLRSSKDMDMLLPDGCRPLLKDGTFVNAVYVNGFHKKHKFLVTQTPSDGNIGNFWKLVHESGTRTIVTLDAFDSEEGEPTVFAGCPSNGGMKFGDLKVECAKELDKEGIRTHTVTITSKLKASPRDPSPEPVKHFQLPTWSRPEAMVDLVDRVERWQQQSGDKIIFVLCRQNVNGCSASGLFCCSALVLEKLKTEQEVDVFYATRIIRESRPQFIEDPEQYQFCYDTASAYLDSVSMYANFVQS
ncbi:unnamed protein product, partial [Ixodes hexagonus]